MPGAVGPDVFVRRQIPQVHLGRERQPHVVSDCAPLVPGEAAVTKEGSPQSTTGLVVGLVTVGAIVIGAGVLYLRYRGRGNTSR